MNEFTTKATKLNDGYGCRVFSNGELILEGKAKTKEEIGPVFRDLLRTLDKCGGDAFTNASRHRKFKEGNKSIAVKHKWYKGEKQ